MDSAPGDEKMHVDEDQRFWDIRAANYDKLFWVRDKSYLEAILEMSELKENHLVLDVGTGTGVVANAVKEHVEHVIAIDVSHAMLEQGQWEGVSAIKWDVGNSLFTAGLFDRVMARMVFHHILGNLDRAVLRCYDVLKDGGKIVVAEGVPPSDDDEVIEWFTEMFKLKEKRRTFTAANLRYFLEKNGFRNVNAAVHVMEDFNVNNWLANSGLSAEIQGQIYDMHVHAGDRIKRAYNMRIENGDCLIETRNVILVGEK